MNPIYTRGGDSGDTSLGDGSRVPKESLRVEAYGTLDELNSALGVLLETFRTTKDVAVEEVVSVQSDLFGIGSHLANPGSAALPALPTGRVAAFESAIDRMTESMPPLNGFILPGGCENSARAHVARTICRRAERRVAVVCHTDKARDCDRFALQYLNRLADYLFSLARYCNHLAGRTDVQWQP